MAFYMPIALFSPLMAQDANTIFTQNGTPLHVRNTGNNTLIELNKADSLFKFNIAVASFPAGKKLDWHYHPDGQILVITDGIGYYQEKGQAKQAVKKGEVIKCLPGVEHWHGASEETGVTYMATYSTLKGSTVWLHKVSDEEYYNKKSPSTPTISMDQEIKDLSKDKWRWMQEFKTDSLSALFHDDAIFVHMGATFSKTQEIDVIKSKGIVYKNAEIQEVSVRIIDNTAILLNKIKLTAIVGGNEVVNPFNVTEVYVKQNDTWKLASLSFTKLLTP